MLGSTGVPAAGGSGGSASGGCAAGCGAGGSTGSSGNWEQLAQRTGIWQLPNRGVAVFHESPAHAETFCSKLKEELQRYEFGAVRFENIDVSSVNWEEGHLSQLFKILQMAGASSQRIKAFRCGAKDPSVLSLCEWLACTEASKIPQEIHLSHNDLTTGSLEALITVLEVKSLRHRPNFPYWIRIEGNRMSTSFINDLAKDGKACLAVGKCSTRSCELMQQGQPPSLLHLRFGANQRAVPANQAVFPSVASSLSGVAPQDGSETAAAFPASEDKSPLLKKIESAHAMMQELRAASCEPMRALAENAAIVAQEELVEAAHQANTAARAAWQVKTTENCPSQAEMQWQQMQAAMQQQQQQQQQQWQQWQQQQLQQQQLQQQQMQAQMQMQQQMQWQAEQQKLQQQQLQAQWNQQQWAQHLQQSQQSMQQPVIQQPVMQPMQTMQPNQSGAPQQTDQTLDEEILRLLKEARAETATSPKKPEATSQPAADERNSRAKAAAAAAAEIEKRMKEQDKQDEEPKGPKLSEQKEEKTKTGEKEAKEQKQQKEQTDKKEATQQKKQKEHKEQKQDKPEKAEKVKDPKESKENSVEQKSTATARKVASSNPTQVTHVIDSPERKEAQTSAGSADPPWRAHRRRADKKPGSRSPTRPLRRTRRSRSRRRRQHRRTRKVRSPSRRAKSPSPPPLKKKPPGANPKTKSSPKVAVPDVGKAKTIVVEEDKAADEAKQQEMKERRERAAEIASLKSAVSQLFGGMM